MTMVAHPPGKLRPPAKRMADSLNRKIPPARPPDSRTTHNPFRLRPMKNNGIASLRTLASGRSGNLADAPAAESKLPGETCIIAAPERHDDATLNRGLRRLAPGYSWKRFCASAGGTDRYRVWNGAT